MRRFRYWVIGIFGLITVSFGHTSEKPITQQTRVAIVIGNSNYKYAPRLTNPQNDALSVKSFLEKQGFEVHNFLDLKSDQVSKIRALTETSITRETNFFSFTQDTVFNLKDETFLYLQMLEPIRFKI